jgi:protein SCO1
MAEQSQPTSPAGREASTRRRRSLIAVGVLAVLVGLLLFLLLGPTTSTNGSTKSAARTFNGIALAHPTPAPPLQLRNYLGQPVNIASFRGKALLVTFIYTHCPDTCPLMVSHLHTALGEMSASERAHLQIVAVSVDPRGDTPAAVAHFLAVHGMTGRMQYLIGSAPQLHAVWRTWGIRASPDTSSPDAVEHSALVYGIDARGQIEVIEPANFTPAAIANDAALLAGA